MPRSGRKNKLGASCCRPIQEGTCTCVILRKIVINYCSLAPGAYEYFGQWKQILKRGGLEKRKDGSPEGAVLEYLINNNFYDISIFIAFLYNLGLQVIIYLPRTNHVLQKQDERIVLVIKGCQTVSLLRSRFLCGHATLLPIT